jgi:hypothetical protein
MRGGGALGGGGSAGWAELIGLGPAHPQVGNLIKYPIPRTP